MSTCTTFLSAALVAVSLAGTATSQIMFAPLGLTGAGAEGRRQLGTVRHDGAVVLRGDADSIAAGAVSTTSGLTAFDGVRQRMYMIGRDESDGTTRLFVIELATGATTSQELTLAQHNLVTGIVYDQFDQRLSVLFDTAGDEQLATLDPSDGSMLAVGAPISGTGLTTSAGVVAHDAAGDRMFFVGRPTGDVDRVYTVDTVTGASSSVPLQSVSMSSIVGMSYGAGPGVILALVRVGSDRQLAEIDPVTGIATLIGSGTIGGGTPIATIQGVTTYDPLGGAFYFVGRASGQWQLYSVSIFDGAGFSNAIDETAIRSGLYAGLEFPVGCQSDSIAYPAICDAGYHVANGPALSITGTPEIGATLTVHADNLLGNAICGLLVGLSIAPLPLSLIGSTVPGSKVCVDAFLTIPCTGGASSDAVLLAPTDPLICGGPFAVQWVEYTGSGMDFGTSRSAELTFGH